MAILKKGKAKQISGVLGHIVYKQFNDKTVIYSRPEKYKRTKCPKARAVRDKFGDVVKFAKHINSNPYLKAIWKQSKIKGFSAYHKIIKTNHKLTVNQKLGETNIIVPNAATLPVLSLNLNRNLTPDRLEISIDKLYNQISRIKIRKLILQSIFVFTNIQGKKKGSLEIDSMKSSLTDINFKDKITLSLELDRYIKNMIELSSELTVYVTLICLKEQNEKIKWFSSYAKSFNLINKSM
jgi:hypothetical protein